MNLFDLDYAFNEGDAVRIEFHPWIEIIDLILIAVDPAVSLAIHWLPLPVLTQGGCKLSANFSKNDQAAVPSEYFDLHGNGINNFLT